MTAATTPRLTRLLITAMAKHLPPSASRLRLLDVEGRAGAVLGELRQDLEVQSVGMMLESTAAENRAAAENSADAVVLYGAGFTPAFLDAALRVLRPGGRLVLVNPNGEPEEALVRALEQAGYTRILVETAAECPLPTGVLLRGEKPHVTDDTLARVSGVAVQDGDLLDLTQYSGRYVHLLVQETPNKPVWARQPDEPVQWGAVAVPRGDSLHLLAFSSLPRAVSFMQPAVLAGQIRDINKVAKFSRATAAAWTLPVLLNPAPEVLSAGVQFVPLDPTTAEAPDE